MRFVKKVLSFKEIIFNHEQFKRRNKRGFETKVFRRGFQKERILFLSRIKQNTMSTCYI